MNNEFDDFDEFAEDVIPQDQPEQPSEQQSELPVEESDFTSEVLKLKGIDDPTKIKFQDESGAIIERDWNTLSKNEQLNILVDQTDGSNDLDEDEIRFLNSVRSSGLSVEDYLNQMMPKPEQPSYKINELSDDEVYVLNLLDTVGSDNITDEELLSLLEVAKLNEGLFLKLVEGLRSKYIQLQQDEEEQQTRTIQAQQQALYDQFANSIQNEIIGLNQFAGRPLQLSREDAENLYDFTTTLDLTGMSAFGRAMQDPAICTRAAFWILNEDEIIAELTKLIQENYTRGYKAGKADNGNSKLVFTQKPTKRTNSIDDIDYDEFN